MDEVTDLVAGDPPRQEQDGATVTLGDEIDNENIDTQTQETDENDRMSAKELFPVPDIDTGSYYDLPDEDNSLSVSDVLASLRPVTGEYAGDLSSEFFRLQPPSLLVNFFRKKNEGMVHQLLGRWDREDLSKTGSSGETFIREGHQNLISLIKVIGNLSGNWKFEVTTYPKYKLYRSNYGRDDENTTKDSMTKDLTTPQHEETSTGSSSIQRAGDEADTQASSGVTSDSSTSSTNVFTQIAHTLTNLVHGFRAPPPTPPETIIRQSLSMPTVIELNLAADPLLVERYRIECAQDFNAFTKATIRVRKALIDAKVERGGRPELLRNEYTVDLASRENAQIIHEMTDGRIADTRSRQNTLSTIPEIELPGPALSTEVDEITEGDGLMSNIQDNTETEDPEDSGTTISKTTTSGLVTYQQQEDFIVKSTSATRRITTWLRVDQYYDANLYNQHPDGTLTQLPDEEADPGHVISAFHQVDVEAASSMPPKKSKAESKHALRELMVAIEKVKQTEHDQPSWFSAVLFAVSRYCLKKLRSQIAAEQDHE